MGSLLLAITLASFSLSADQAQYDKIANPQTSGSQVYQIIDALKVRTFAVDSFIKNKIAPDEMKTWISLVTDANQYVLDQVKKGKAPQQFVDITAQLFSILNFISTTANQLYTQKNNINIMKINELISKAQSLLKETRKINRTILAQNTIPQSWISTVPKDPNSIVIKLDPAKPGEKIFVPKQVTYQDFFKDVKNIDAVRNLTPEGFRRFLYLKNIDNKFTIAAALDSFEKIAYRLKEISKNQGWFDWTNYKKDIEYATVFADKIKESYPDSLSKLDVALFTAMTDKPSLIIFAQAGAYEGALTRIIKDLNSLKPAGQ